MKISATLIRWRRTKTVRGGENYCFVWSGNFLAQVPKFSGIFPKPRFFRRFTWSSVTGIPHPFLYYTSYTGVFYIPPCTPSTRRVTTAAFCCTFHHVGKLAQAGVGGGCTRTVHGMHDHWHLQYLQEEKKALLEHKQNTK